jgi:complement component 1 Q subcomponent-binding protein
MALFAAARRAATCSLPLLRASASGAVSRVPSLLRPLAAAAARPMPFSSATALKPSSDEELLRVIKSEIKFAEDCDDHDRVRTAELPIQILTMVALSIYPRFSSV